MPQSLGPALHPPWLQGCPQCGVGPKVCCAGGLAGGLHTLQGRPQGRQGHAGWLAGWLAGWIHPQGRQGHAGDAAGRRRSCRDGWCSLGGALALDSWAYSLQHTPKAIVSM
jgi:hypothetical protein